LTRFNSVVLDVDSTLSGIEGIDWLASLRGSEVEETIAGLTDQAMRGAIPLESVYRRRLEAVRPTKAEVTELASQYVLNLAPNAKESIALLRSRGVEVVVVSGGLREAILPLAAEVGLKPDSVHAVQVFFDAQGHYRGFDERSLLARQNGKREAVARLNLRPPLMAVGDGITDTEIRACADSFAAYTGFVRREAVVAKADLVIEDFRQLAQMVLG
jgi:phosphoserine phosphatase